MKKLMYAAVGVSLLAQPIGCSSIRGSGGHRGAFTSAIMAPVRAVGRVAEGTVETATGQGPVWERAAERRAVRRGVRRMDSRGVEVEKTSAVRGQRPVQKAVVEEKAAETHETHAMHPKKHHAKTKDHVKHKKTQTHTKARTRKIKRAEGVVEKRSAHYNHRAMSPKKSGVKPQFRAG